MDCLNFFTFGLESNRPKGRKYGKKKGVDPKDIQDLPRQCPNASCGKTKDTSFKYYNNNSNTQPCFKCLSCNQLFHMRIIINGIERYLVHNKPRAPRTKSIKSPKIPKGRNCHRKPNHVQNGLLHLDMFPNEMHEYDMAHSMEATNGGLEDINMYDCNCDCRGLPEVGFNDQVPLNGPLEESNMLDDQIGPSYYGTSLHMVTHETNQAPMCSTHEISFFQPCDKEAALMANNIEDNMAIILEDCQMAMEGFQALESQNSLIC
jgi:hypothetical protein